MNQRPLQGQAAIVTGAGRGIGRAIAHRLAAAGASVAIASRTKSEIDATRRSIEEAGGRALAISADVTQAGNVALLIEQSRRAFGHLDILVNNAGVAPLAEIEQMSPANFDAVLATNIRAVYLCCRAVWPIMSAGGGGAIINISSVAAYDPLPGFAAYGAAKAFVNAYTRALAAEGAAKNIRVYAVAPGAVETAMLRRAFPAFPKEQTLSPDEVAALVETLLLPAYRHVSGQTITIRKG
jgi:NAD(P)-dependent dehydrogenase (short-subunit alcohol dehydrogenase family)